MTEQYAYGDWKVSGVKCPIASAGLDNAEFSVELAEQYDEVVGVAHGKGDEGILQENEAREAWKQLMTQLARNTSTDYRNNGGVLLNEQMLELAEMVEENEFEG